MATILITGGTGMIGSALTRALLAAGHSLIIVTRHSRASSDKRICYAQWNIDEGTIDETAIEAADYIIHLAGANVADGRWTKKRKQEIVESRVRSGSLLVNALRQHTNKVQAVISASAIGWYGADKQVPNLSPFTEADTADNGFLGETCRQWEEAVEPVTQLNKRLVTFRIGIVLSNEGGAYAEFKKPLQFGTATILGNGKQVVSWIHIDDLVKLFITAIENKNLQGVYNAVAPNPVTNKELIMEIARQRGKFFIPLPVPSAALKIALGEMSIEVLKSATVSSKKIEATGFTFQYPTIKQAVDDLGDVKREK